MDALILATLETPKDQVTAHLAAGIRKTFMITEMNRHAMLRILFGQIYILEVIFHSSMDHTKSYTLCLEYISHKRHEFDQRTASIFLGVCTWFKYRFVYLFI